MYCCVAIKSLLARFSNSMYAVTAALLLLLAAVASYNMKVFPTSLFVAIAACSILDVAVRKLFLKKELKFQASAAISGIIIGSIAPLSAPAAAILVASAVAIVSKYVVRIKGRHVFNPATLGLLAALSLFRLGDMWWAASGFNFAGFAVPVTFLLIIANYKADKLKVSVPFLVVTAVLYAATQLAGVPLTAAGALNFLTSLPFYFAFIMLSEPRTSPNEAREQVVFGVAVALLVFALDAQARVKYAFFIALLAGNLGYSLYRNYRVLPIEKK